MGAFLFEEKLERELIRIREKEKIMEGKDETTKLFAILLKENKIEDLTRCTSDKDYLDRRPDELVHSKK